MNETTTVRKKKKPMTCPFCTGTMKTASHFRLEDQGTKYPASLSLTFDRNPGATLFTGKTRLPFRPCVCPDCGYVAFFVDQKQIPFGPKDEKTERSPTNEGRKTIF
ncbi:MAG: hypothetical protein AAF492_31275 [Verrucomicrobiota bacterium]